MDPALSLPESSNPELAPPVVRDPLVHYGFYAALIFAGICLAFTVFYISSYSKDTTVSFENHIQAFLDSSDTNNLVAVLGARTAQNKTLLQSCGVVAGISFGFLGFALFLLGVKGTVDGGGGLAQYSFTFKRLAPGSLILLAAMALVGISAVHAIELDIGPSGSRTGAVRSMVPPPASADQAAPAPPISIPHSDNSQP